ncbi:hypothetical protein [Haloferax sp. Q22]|uniref:hypothetical protein n=1 Tax=Haloferax sp. (strain Q22) TaxID=1526048 RepID=UPI000737CE26|nr:hypothetical protein [Haloferax sp. Q22]
MTDSPVWKQDVTVIGLGETGSETVEMIGTEADVNLYTVNSTPELEACFKDVEESDFLFLSGDLNEEKVESQVQTLLQHCTGVSVLFAEGVHSLPEDLVSELNLLIPVKAEFLPRSIISSYIADLFECMMPLTVHDLGHNDVRITAGENRVGKLYIDTPNNKQPYPLSTLKDCENPESILLFACSGEKQDQGKIRNQIEEYSFPDSVDLLWDQRIEPRYIGTPHVKYIVTYQAQEDNFNWEDKEEIGGRGEITVDDIDFLRRKND